MPSSTTQRRALFDLQHGRCYYCNIDMTMREGKSNTCTRDHIIPQSIGGEDRINNLVGACFTCNNARGMMPATAFLAMIMFGNGIARSPLRTTNRRPATLSDIFARLEIDIAEQVRNFARLRYVQDGISWSNNRLPSVPFHKNGAATFTLSEVWPCHE